MLKKILKISYLRQSAIRSFKIIDDKISLISDQPFLDLDLISSKTSFKNSSKLDSAGTIYTISLSGMLKSADPEFRSAAAMGVILKITTADGYEFIAGTEDFPLTGSVAVNIPAMAKDAAGYNFSLSGRQLHDIFPLL